MVLLHDEHVRRFLVVWNQAQAASVVLPKTDDPAYASLETLLRHVLGAARGYMTWMCEVLELPDPQIRIPPEPTALLEHAVMHPIRHAFQLEELMHQRRLVEGVP